jgi:2-polyprenyl-6-methoxyphenol hydroxylase-like FAD-dependent oxidoreductase
VPCRLGVALTGLIQDGQRVSVTFAEGPAGDYDLVVGADGTNSTVRPLAVSARSPRYADTMICGAMAIEDAVVLARLLRETATIADCLDRYQARRRPRVQWVQKQSRLAAQAAMLPLATRNAALREHGDQMIRDRYQPLIPVP